MDDGRDLSIGIIGGGLSGALVAIELLRQADFPIEITIYEPAARLGAGLAYGAAGPNHLMNATAARVSLSDDPDDFRAFCAANGPRLGWPALVEAGPDDYLPRQLFAEYAATAVERAVRRAGPRATLIHRRARVLGLCRAGTGFELRVAGGATARHDRVVLATGNGAATPRIPGYDEARRQGLIAGDPWSRALTDGLGPEAPVLLLGSGLTMADAVVSLITRGHRGPLHVLSRRGLVPEARQPMPDRTMVIDPIAPPRRASHLLALLRGLIRDHADGDWQTAFEALRPLVKHLWHQLEDAERRRLWRHMRPYYDAHRFRMPPATAGLIARLRQDGRLTVLAGQVERVEPQWDGARVVWRGRGSDVLHELDVARIVNCTGLARGPDADPLLRRLLRQGLVRPGCGGNGLDADETGRLGPDLFAIGPLLRGNALDPAVIPEIRTQATTLGEALLRPIERGKAVGGARRGERPAARLLN